MKRFITYGSIDQFSTVTKNLQRQAQFVSYDEVTKEVTMDRTALSPTIVATGSEKIHGTNASVCYSIPDGFWVQSRKNIITPEKDNAGCAFQTYAYENEWAEIIFGLANEYSIDLNKHIISVYFEWSGGNVQKKSALTGLDKRSMIFQYFKVSPIEPQIGNDGAEIPESAKWLETKTTVSLPKGFVDPSYITDDMRTKWVSNEDKNIYNIMNFPTVEIVIDFNDAKMSQNTLIKLVDEIEQDSPVGKQFGIDNNIAEGYVFTFDYKDEVYRFKVKGEEHSKGSGKVKVLKPVDEALENRKRAFVNDIACTEGRLEQMYQEIINATHNGDETRIGMTDMKEFLGLVMRDVVKEHTQDMIDEGFEPKVLNGNISKAAVQYFKSKVL